MAGKRKGWVLKTNTGKLIPPTAMLVFLTNILSTFQVKKNTAFEVTDSKKIISS